MMALPRSPSEDSAEVAQLRNDVRTFLAAELAADGFVAACDSWQSGFSAGFSRKLGERGWLGMTWPKQYGGHERSQLERLTVNEELLAAGAPVAAHWFADRQVGPSLLRYGHADLRARLLPSMARGELFFAIGMSEPDTGSDLASVRTTAARASDGWTLSGRKVWTSHAHHAHFMVTLARTAAMEPGSRHGGLSQFIVDLRGSGVTVNPIRYMDGQHHFNEVVLDGAFVAEDMLLGDEGDGWSQVTSELAYERSGPERFLSTMPLLAEVVRRVRPTSPAVVELLAELKVLRQLSRSVAVALQEGLAPQVQAALVKDLGSRFESRVIDVARSSVAVEPDPTSDDPLVRHLGEAVLHAPAFTIRGGTNEILRGIVAKSLAAL